LLSSCRDGCTEPIMLAHGFKTGMMVEIVNAGLASVTTERVAAGKHRIEVPRVRITEAGGGRWRIAPSTDAGYRCQTSPLSGANPGPHLLGEYFSV
jgi:hypothetical protein